MREINASELKTLIGSVNIIDLRQNITSSDTVPTALYIKPSLLMAAPDKYLARDKTYYLICQTGGVSRTVCYTLSMLGYNVVNVVGGVNAFHNRIPKYPYNYFI